VLLKQFIQGGSFGRKMHAWCKQTANGTGGFAVGEGLATTSGDMHMQPEELTIRSGDMHSKGNRQFDWRVPTT